MFSFKIDLSLHGIMRNTARYMRWCLFTAVTLLCMMVFHAEVTTTESSLAEPAKLVDAMHDVQEKRCASFCKEEPDMPRTMRETGQWGLPSATVTIQGTASRLLTLGETLLRISRSYSTLQTIGTAHAVVAVEALHRTLSTKRFRSGYYLYYRCQMRC